MINSIASPIFPPGTTNVFMGGNGLGGTGHDADVTHERVEESARVIGNAKAIDERGARGG